MTDSTLVPNWLLVVLILLAFYGAAIIAYVGYSAIADALHTAKARRKRREQDADAQEYAGYVALYQAMIDYAQEVWEHTDV